MYFRSTERKKNSFHSIFNALIRAHPVAHVHDYFACSEYVAFHLKGQMYENEFPLSLRTKIHSFGQLLLIYAMYQLLLSLLEEKNRVKYAQQTMICFQQFHIHPFKNVYALKTNSEPFKNSYSTTQDHCFYFIEQVIVVARATRLSRHFRQTFIVPLVTSRYNPPIR